MKQWKWAAVAASCAVVLAGCGGASDGADTTTKTVAPSVKVFGDSLQDSGTFGFKATVQASNNLLYVERIAANYGQTLCNFFTFTGTTFAANTAKTGCTNYAIAGGVITYTGTGGAANPLTIGTQMATFAATGSFTASDLVIVDGGGNDAANIIGAYLKAKTDAGAAYSGLLGTLLTTSQITTALTGGATTTAAIGGTNGVYNFTGLTPGSYVVIISNPPRTPLELALLVQPLRVPVRECRQPARLSVHR